MEEPRKKKIVDSVDVSMRPVSGGFIQRIWLGDCWRWATYDSEVNRIPFGTAHTKDAAIAKVKEHAEKQGKG